MKIVLIIAILTTYIILRRKQKEKPPFNVVFDKKKGIYIIKPNVEQPQIVINTYWIQDDKRKGRNTKVVRKGLPK